MGGFYPYTKEANFNKIGENSGEGFNINIPWNIVEDPETKKKCIPNSNDYIFIC